MAIVYGVQPTGFLSKPRSVIKDEMDAGYRAILGDSAGTEPDGSIPLRSIAGQQIAFHTDREAGLWDLAQAIYTSFDPDLATDAAQDAVCALTGTIRKGASFSIVTCVCTGTPGTVLLAGRIATVETSKSRFASLAQVAIAALTSWVGTTAYAAGDRRTNANRAYLCITAGTSAGAGGPTTTALDITDGTVHWRYLGEGTGAVDAVFVASVSGAIGALAGKLNTIGTPVSGWRNVVNLLDAVVGAAKETNSALRVRRQLELSLSGNATADAILANVLTLNQDSQDPLHLPVKSARVLHNDTDFIDANGLPPHSVEVLALEGTDADIALTVWNSVAAGIATYGNQSTVVTDSQGNPQTVRWSRPEDVLIWIVGTVYYDASKWPVSGASAAVVQASLSALLTFADDYPVGRSVRSVPLTGAIVDEPSQVDSAGLAVVPAAAGSAPAPGILDVSPFNFGTAPAPVTSTPVAVGVRQIARFDTSRISLTAVAETP